VSSRIPPDKNNYNNTQAAVVTTSLQQILDDVLADLLSWRSNHTNSSIANDLRQQQQQQQQPDDTSWKSWSIKRWYTRLGDILDTLKSYGFRFDQILQAVSTMVATTNNHDKMITTTTTTTTTVPHHDSLTLERVLDWLCLHLPTDQLPAIFTEGQVRDNSRIGGKDSTTVTVITATNQASHRNSGPELAMFLPPTRNSICPRIDHPLLQTMMMRRKNNFGKLLKKIGSYLSISTKKSISVMKAIQIILLVKIHY
jgi:hypothetical protein